MLTQADKERIETAVKAAEARTSGEIFVVLSGEVSRYREVPLAWAAAIALAVPPIVLSLSLVPLTDLASQLWLAGQAGALQSELAMALGLYAAIQVILFLIILAIVHAPPVRQALTPRALKAHRVAKAAQHHFAAISARAAGETGVLIFVAVDDRQVQILADAGIHQKCGEGPWTAGAEAISQAMKAGDDPTGGIIKAVEICGQALAEHYPGQGPADPAFSPRPMEA